MGDKIGKTIIGEPMPARRILEGKKMSRIPKTTMPWRLSKQLFSCSQNLEERFHESRKQDRKREFMFEMQLVRMPANEITTG